MAYKITFYAFLLIVGCMHINGNAGISPKLQLVARADGKAFFAHLSPRNWTEASKYCQGEGMRLATITSQAQYSALVDARSPNFDYYYWTAGRDSREVTQFVWNNTNDALSPSYLTFVDDYRIPVQTCVVFETRAIPYQGVLRPRPCSSTNPGILCET